MKIKAIIHEAEEGGFWAEVPGIPGCVTQGDALTTDQVRDTLERVRDKSYCTSNAVIGRLEKMLARAKAPAKTRR